MLMAMVQLVRKSSSKCLAVAMLTNAVSKFGMKLWLRLIRIKMVKSHSKNLRLA